MLDEFLPRLCKLGHASGSATWQLIVITELRQLTTSLFDHRPYQLPDLCLSLVSEALAAEVIGRRRHDGSTVVWRVPRQKDVQNDFFG